MAPKGEFLVSEATERHSNLLLIVILVSAAVMHAVPQVREYLLTTWMVVALGGAAFLSLLLLQDWTQQARDRLTRFHWILLIVYLVSSRNMALICSDEDIFFPPTSRTWSANSAGEADP